MTNRPEKYKTEGRFEDRIALLVKMIAERHVLTRRRSKKILAGILADPRSIAFIMEAANRCLTGRGDGLTLIDLGENENVKQILKRDKKRSVKK